jgi:hypothetical protein
MILIFKAKIISKKITSALEYILLTSFIYFCMLPMQDLAILQIYQVRDMQRALDMTLGKIYLFGPELTGGGHIFGNFYYFLLSLPFRLGLGWQGAWHLALLLFSLAVSYFVIFIRKKINLTYAIYALLVLCSLNIYNAELRCFWNPSYQFLFLFVSILPLAEILYIDSRVKHVSLRLLMSGLFLGFALQIHLISIIVLISFLLIFIFPRKLKLKKLNMLEIATWFTGIMISYLYYLFFLLVDFFHPIHLISSSPEKTNILSAISELSKTEQHQVKFMGEPFVRLMPISILVSSFLLPVLFFYYGKYKKTNPDSNGVEKVTEQTFVSHAEALSYLKIGLIIICVSAYNLIKFLLWGKFDRYMTVFEFGFILFAIFVPILFLKKNKQIRYLIASLLLFIFYRVYLSGYEHSIDLMLNYKETFLGLSYSSFIASFISLILLFGYYRHTHKNSSIPTFIFVLILGIAINMTFVFRSNINIDHLKKYSKNVSNTNIELIELKNLLEIKKPRPFISEFKPLANAIYQLTGWSYDEARLKIFYHNLDTQITMENIYMDVFNKNKYKSPIIKTDIDGMFVFYLPQKKTRKDSKEFALNNTPLDVILNQINDFSNNSVLLNEIKLDNPIFVHKFMLVPYHSNNTKSRFIYYQNIGFSYQDFIDEKYINFNLLNKLGTYSFPDNLYSFYWNLCPYVTCNIGSTVKMSRLNDKLLSFVVEILGRPLSISSPSENPDMHLGMVNPYLQINCDGKIIKKVIINKIGHFHGYVLKKVLNNIPLAPLRKEMQVECKTVNDLTFGWQKIELMGKRKEVQVISNFQTIKW